MHSIKFPDFIIVNDHTIVWHSIAIRNTIIFEKIVSCLLLKLIAHHNMIIQKNERKSDKSLKNFKLMRL